MRNSACARLQAHNWILLIAGAAAALAVTSPLGTRVAWAGPNSLAPVSCRPSPPGSETKPSSCRYTPAPSPTARTPG